ncbi:MAG: NADH-quinone oxidoreductase subunit NuoE [Gammaproteobacteria bacterium]|jgi:NADH-quinone oxidoreductase subunit E
MLSESEKQQIDHEAQAYPDRRAVGIDALLTVQRERGWISDETLRDVATYLGISPDALEGVATFYNLIHRRPVGRHVIRLCDSVSCWLCGYGEIHARLRQALGIDFGQTSADGRFTLLPNVCLGRCEYAPVMLIDDDAHDDLTAHKLDAILARYA